MQGSLNGALPRMRAMTQPGTLPAVARLRPVAVPASATVQVAERPEGAAPLTGEQERLLLDHLTIVRYVARAIHERLPQHVELDELVGAGTLGLVDAARKFNPGKNVQFRSYAQFRIRGAILDSLRSLDWSPRELRRKGRAMEEATRTLEARLGRAPQDAEVAGEMGLSLAHLQQLAGQLKGLEMTALNAERNEDSGEEELAFLPAKESENPLFQCLDGERKQRLAEAIESLAERERLVMTLYYFEEMTMKEIGMVLGVVESRVSQIHHLAVKRLRTLLADLGGRGGKSTHAQLRARRAS